MALRGLLESLKRRKRSVTSASNKHDVWHTSIEFTDDKHRVGVKFSHTGRMAVDDITRHSRDINRKTAEMKGNYDGWETIVER
jgi:hypothetical protein